MRHITFTQILKVKPMRHISLLMLTILIPATLAFADDPLADLRSEVAAITAKATLTSTESSHGDGGPKLVNNSAKLSGDEATYGLVYKSFLPPNDKRNRSELNDWSSGLGMVQPSDKGWYSNGFVDVGLANASSSASISDSCGVAKMVAESGKAVAIDFNWNLPTGKVTLRFFLIADRPELFLLITVKPSAPDAKATVEFRCYPGGFNSPFDRHVHTATREVIHAGPGVAEAQIDPVKEPWMLLADHYAGVVMRPMGPSSIAIDPTEIESAGVRIQGNYSVLPHYVLKPGAISALFVMREFTPTSWQSAKDEVAGTTAEALIAGHKALTSLPEVKD